MGLCKRCLSEASVDSCDRCEEPLLGWIHKKDVEEAIKKKILDHDDGDCNHDALNELLKELVEDG